VVVVVIVCPIPQLISSYFVDAAECPCSMSTFERVTAKAGLLGDDAEGGVDALIWYEKRP